VRVCASSTGTAACVVEVEADAATSGRVPRHAPEACGLGKRGRERTIKRWYELMVKSKQPLEKRSMEESGEKDRDKHMPSGQGWKASSALLCLLCSALSS